VRSSPHPAGMTSLCNATTRTQAAVFMKETYSDLLNRHERSIMLCVCVFMHHLALVMTSCAPCAKRPVSNVSS
jgi:hypothetical protein